jgi:hypothetical protein
VAKPQRFKLTATQNTIQQMKIAVTPARVQRYLGISVIFSYKGQRRREVEQTPEGMVLAGKL